MYFNMKRIILKQKKLSREWPTSENRENKLLVKVSCFTVCNSLSFEQTLNNLMPECSRGMWLDICVVTIKFAHNTVIAYTFRFCFVMYEYIKFSFSFHCYSPKHAPTEVSFIVPGLFSSTHVKLKSCSIPQPKPFFFKSSNLVLSLFIPSSQLKPAQYIIIYTHTVETRPDFIYIPPTEFLTERERFFFSDHQRWLFHSSHCLRLGVRICICACFDSIRKIEPLSRQLHLCDASKADEGEIGWHRLWSWRMRGGAWLGVRCFSPPGHARIKGFSLLVKNASSNLAQNPSEIKVSWPPQWNLLKNGPEILLLTPTFYKMWRFKRKKKVCRSLRTLSSQSQDLTYLTVHTHTAMQIQCVNWTKSYWIHVQYHKVKHTITLYLPNTKYYPTHIAQSTLNCQFLFAQHGIFCWFQTIYYLKCILIVCSYSNEINKMRSWLIAIIFFMILSYY